MWETGGRPPVSNNSNSHVETIDNPSVLDPDTEDDIDLNKEEENENMRQVSLPDESELVLLCLDYLRDLRRAYTPSALLESEQVHADYLTLACWALTRALDTPPLNVCHPDTEEDGNDAWFDASRQSVKHTINPKFLKQMVQRPKLQSDRNNSLPSIKEMEDELLYRGPAAHPRQEHIAETNSGLEIVNDSSALNSSLLSGGNLAGADLLSSDKVYEYDDSHPSNAHRFYPLQGLASGSDLPGPLTLGEMVAAGLIGLNARTRRQAEAAFSAEPLFENYVAAVESKGFFDLDASLSKKERDLIAKERYAKVVAKFRVKLAHTALEEQTQGGGVGVWNEQEYLASLTAAEQQRQRRETRRLYALQNGGHSANVAGQNQNNNDHSPTDDSNPPQHLFHHSHNHPFYHNLQQAHQEDEKTDKDSDVNGGGSNVGTEASVASYVKRMAFAQKLFSTHGVGAQLSSSNRHDHNGKAKHSTDATSKSRTSSFRHPPTQHPPSQSKVNHPRDLQEAERFKTQGNTHMQRKEYEEAAQCYTKALKLSPAGPYSHVYFSNRAAALVSLRQFDEALLDSERALTLQPDYSKAHARLGLAHFLMGNYAEAREAYQVALSLEPGNASNQSYLEKATKRLAEQQEKQDQVEEEEEEEEESQRRTKRSSRSRSKGRHMRSPNSESAKTSMSSSTAAASATASLKEAEKYKTRGNSLMASREYEKALEAYTQALRCSSNGPQSHVYYSNRAAALCYLERYQEAEEDSLQSLELDPTYGKAHARLGLSRFFLHDYEGAVSAYTQALEYDPDNAASQSYLQKAKAKLAKQKARQQQHHDASVMSGGGTLSPPSSQNRKSHHHSHNKSSKQHASSSSALSSQPSSSLSPEHTRSRNKDPVDPLPDITARRLLHDENLRSMATKAMANPSAKDLLSDPDMHELSKKAMAAMRKA